MSLHDEVYDALDLSEWRQLLEVRERIIKHRGLDPGELSSQMQVPLGVVYVGLARLARDGYAERNEKIFSSKQQIAQNPETVSVYRRTEKEFRRAEQAYQEMSA